MTTYWFDNNSMLLTVRGLTNERTGAAIIASSGVAVTADIRDRDNVLLAGSAITLSADATAGNWSGVFPRTLVVTDQHHIRLIADGGASLYMDRDIPLKPRRRVA